jgi:hypothetical protein
MPQQIFYFFCAKPPNFLLIIFNKEAFKTVKFINFALYTNFLIFARILNVQKFNLQIRKIKTWLKIQKTII